MPLIACPHCRSRFKVPLHRVGQTLPCPRCRQPFEALALRERTRQHGSGPIVYAAILVGAVLVAILISAMTGSDEPADETAAAADSGADRASRAPAKEASAPLTPQQILVEQTRKLLDALRSGSHPLLPGWIAFETMHEQRVKDGLESRPWSELSAEESYAKREEYLGHLQGGDADREFARAATVEQVEVLSFGSGRARVRALLHNALTGEQRELLLHFATAAGLWKVYALARPAPAAPAAPAADPAAAVERVLERRRNPEGEVAPVELLADTPESVTRSINGALATLRDLSATREANEARAILVQAGKPAIPHLLNALVDLDLQAETDLAVATRLSGALVDLTGQDYALVPGLNEGSMLGEGAADNEQNRRLWFGWWRDNQNTYQGPPVPEQPAEGTEDGRRRRRGG